MSGPSGVGKTTILKTLFADCPLKIEESVSATTRPRRPGETDGESYHYLSDAQFRKHIENDEFLEYVEVFNRGHLYGTLRQPVVDALASGRSILLELDVAGALKVLKFYPSAITIFIHPGSLSELERRLRGRATDAEDAIQRRLEVARSEIEAAEHYQHIIYNQSVQQTATDICTLLMAAEKN